MMLFKKDDPIEEEIRVYEIEEHTLGGQCLVRTYICRCCCIITGVSITPLEPVTDVARLSDL
jgi:hypothetical protein